MRRTTTAVLITGLFGSGKSTVTADLGDLLEEAGIPYAALDLDWLTWSNAGGDTRDHEHRMLLRNLRSIVSNYLEAGVTHFVLARTIRDRAELATVAAAIDMPLRTVELDVALDVIERRIASDPTDGRQKDFARTLSWAERGSATGFADVVVRNDRPVREVSLEIVAWLVWTN